MVLWEREGERDREKRERERRIEIFWTGDMKTALIAKWIFTLLRDPTQRGIQAGSMCWH